MFPALCPLAGNFGPEIDLTVSEQPVSKVYAETDSTQSCKVSILSPLFQRSHIKQCSIVLVSPPREFKSILQTVPLVSIYGPNNRGRSASVLSRARVASFYVRIPNGPTIAGNVRTDSCNMTCFAIRTASPCIPYCTSGPLVTVADGLSQCLS